jgi:hypothetical protein
MATASGAGNSHYLIEGYIKASVALKQFQDNGDRDSLNDAARIICDMLRRVVSDDDFWKDVKNISSSLDSESARAEAKRNLETLDLFLAAESDVFRALGFPPATTSVLIYDLSIALHAFDTDPSPELFDRLRNSLPGAAEAVCAMASTGIRRDDPEQKALVHYHDRRQHHEFRGHPNNVALNYWWCGV